MRIIFSSAVMALAAGFSLPSFAADTDSGFYGGYSIGRASSSNGDVVRDKLAIGFRAGYQFNKHVGAEVFTSTLSFIAFPNYFSKGEYYPDQHTGIAVTGAIPLSQRFSLTGRAGVGRTKMHSTSVRKSDYSETDPNIGAGIKFSFNQHWSINAEAMRLTKTKVTVITSGVRYQF